MELKSAEVSPPLPAANQVSLHRHLATSQQAFPRLVRRTYKGFRSISMPAPRLVAKPILWLFLAIRGTYHEALRIFICEPFLKANCAKYGRGLRTGCFLHWIIGKGDIVLGDNVTLDGKASISFAARFADRPVLEIGDNTGVGHDCSFTVGKRISIGRNCNLSGAVTIMDSNGHPSDPALRLDQKPPDSEDVRPVTIGDNVWIGRHSIIFPGVKIGEGSVISAGSVVRTHVPPYSVVAGNPARVMFRLKKLGESS